MRVLLLPVGAHSRAVRLEQVHEVMAAPSLTTVPGAPPAVLGLCHRRGDVLAVLSLTTALGLGPPSPTERAAAWVVVVDAPGGLAGLAVTSVPKLGGRDEPVEPRGVTPGPQAAPLLDLDAVLPGADRSAAVIDPVGIVAGETDTRLDALAAGLLRLDFGLDPDLIEELVRTAHAIAAAPAAGGFDEVCSVARIMEALLRELGDGVRPASAALVEALLRTVDGLRTMVGRVQEGADVSNLARAHRVALEPFSAAASCSPVSITTGPLRGLVVEAAQHTYALPLDAVITAGIGGDPLWMDGAPVEIVGLDQVLDPGGDAAPSSAGAVVVVRGDGRPLGFRVDALRGPRPMVVTILPALLPPIPLLAGATIEPDGTVLCVLDGPGLVAHARAARSPAQR
ncbi:MAG: hypothetical protein NVSMB12_06020 [Acidimicrobiales bacterium]